MKKYISLTSMFLAVFLMTIMTVIPHHHHGGITCIAFERCALDGHLNDVHTSHSDSESNETDHCALKRINLYLGFSHSSKWHPSFFLLYTLLFCSVVKLLSLLFFHLSRWIYYNKCVFHIVQWIGNVLGLRAPPALAL